MKRCPICKKEFQASGRCPEDGATLIDADQQADPMIGRIIQGYKIERPLGAGGLGVVYLAKQLTLDRYVAIKLLHPSRTDGGESLPRFLREARLLSQLNHANIVQIIEFGNTEDGLAFMAMEYVTGLTLREFVEEHGGLHLEQCLVIAGQIAAAVQAAHDMKIIHRDLKPQNIIVSSGPDGAPLAKLLDFGIGKSLLGGTKELTATSVVLGTPGYLAPEQIQSAKEADERADIYALGAIIYFMVAGHPPYRSDHVASLLAHQLIQPPEPLIMEALHDPSAMVLEDIIMKALQRNPADRFQSARELNVAIRDLNRTLTAGGTLDSGITLNARPSPSPARSSPASTPPTPKGGRSWAATIAACSVMFVLSGVGWWRWGAHASSTIPSEQAEEEQASNVRGVTAKEITLGMSAAFSGAARELGRGMKLGVETALAEANAAGGVAGRTIKLVALDDAYDPEKAVANTKELFEQHKVFALLGNVGTPTTSEVLPMVLDSKTLLFGPFTGTDKLRRDPPDRYVFNYRASYREEVQEIVKHFVEKRQIEPTKIAIFSQDDAFGQTGVTAVKSVLSSYGVNPEAVINVTYLRNTRIVEPAVQQVLAKRNDIKGIIIFATYGASSRFTKLLRESSMNAVLANVSFVGSKALSEEFDELGAELGKGVIVTEVVPRYDGYSTLAQRFKTQVSTYFPNENPSSVSLEGYVAARLFIEGLKRTGRALDTEKLADKLESIRKLDLGSGTPLTFSPSDHQASHKVWAVVLDEFGRLQDFEL